MNNQSLGYNPNSTIGEMEPHLAPENMAVNQTYFSELVDLPSVNIFQKGECIDCLFPYCTENRYECHAPGGLKRILYEFHEDSNPIERCCCFHCRGFKMQINNIINPKNNISVLMEGRKPCSLVCLYGCGCGKPSLSVNITSPVGMNLGKAKLNYNSCFCAIFKNRIDIFDNAGQIRFCIRPNCFCIGCFCGSYAKCCDILYHIYQNDVAVGNVTKLTCNEFRTFCTKANDFTINFPPQAKPEEKMLIIIGVILLDYLSFPL